MEIVMSLDIMIFNFDEQEIRSVVNESGETWFIARDILKALDYDVSQIGRVLSNKLEEDERGTTSMSYADGNKTFATINESGMYALIFASQKDKAKVFRKWVTSVMLPSIRKTGSYSIPALPNSCNNILDRYKEINALIEFRESIPEARRKLCDAIVFPEFNIPMPMRTSLFDKETFPELAKDIDRFNEDLSTKKLLTATNLAAIYGVDSPQKMNKVLANKGLQYRDAKTRIWLPTKLGLEHGKFLDKSALPNIDNSIRVWRWMRSVIDMIS